eukprot:2266872-Amphidinium_carterae.1
MKSHMSFNMLSLRQTKTVALNQTHCPGQLEVHVLWCFGDQRSTTHVCGCCAAFSSEQLTMLLLHRCQQGAAHNGQKQEERTMRSKHNASGNLERCWDV